MILGDDHKLMGETAKISKAKLGCAIYRRPPYYRKAGHIQSEFNKEPLAKRCAHTVHFLQDVELMTHADYFVGGSAASSLLTGHCRRTITRELRTCHNESPTRAPLTCWHSHVACASLYP